jgi:tetratricopeptide (TPR) repeat protein
MSENIESTQPTKIKKKSRLGRISITLLGFLIIVGLGLYGGYNSGIGIRRSAEATQISSALTKQFELGAIALAEGRYDHARQHFEYIIQHNPTYPGAAEGMAEAILGMSFTVTPTITPSPTLTPTPDLRGVEAIFGNAQALLNAGNWANALEALDQLRAEDPTYRTAKVDGMYYFALRYAGVDKISKEGDLEGGIYYLTLAERFGPLDSTAAGVREGARLYITAASFWEINWGQAVNYFGQLASFAPNTWDNASNMNAAQRYQYALMRYGDQLFAQDDACGAYTQYSTATAYGALDETANYNAARAFNICYPPTATPEPTAVIPAETPVDTPVP